MPEAWGALAERGVDWEVTTATTLLQAGADIVVLRHPRHAWRPVREAIDELTRERERWPSAASQIYKLLPKTNCQECGLPTCLAFAMKLAQKGTELDKCPYVPEEAKAALDAASAPPIRLVTVGAGDRAFAVGNETVMFRHEKTFVHQPGLVLRVRSDAADIADSGGPLRPPTTSTAWA